MSSSMLGFPCISSTAVAVVAIFASRRVASRFLETRGFRAINVAWTGKSTNAAFATSQAVATDASLTLLGSTVALHHSPRSERTDTPWPWGVTEDRGLMARPGETTPSVVGLSQQDEVPPGPDSHPHLVLPFGIGGASSGDRLARAIAGARASSF